MQQTFRPRTLILFLGDLFFFTLALWLSLYVRAFELPTLSLLMLHLVPFSILFVVWVGVFFVAGLYESQSIIFARRALSGTLLLSQTLNVAIAALFFFFVPIFGVAPRTVLVIYLATSFLCVLAWRAFLFPWLRIQSPSRAVVVGKSAEIEALVDALSGALYSPARVVAVVEPVSGSLAELVGRAVKDNHATFVIADFADARVCASFPDLYNYLFRGVRFFDSSALYEEVFGRIPLSSISERWLVDHATQSVHILYDPLKRLIDLVCGFALGMLSLLVYPFIMLAIMLDDGRPIFISQERIGLGGKPFRIHKFRSMSGNDQGRYGTGGTTRLVVTRVGRVLRTTRLDELPQFWNIVWGNLSLIGPRPELPALVETYEREIPFYQARHLIKPGLSGSAQLYYHGDPHHGTDVESTKMKLSYDLFYLKHRSLSLDISIGIKTIRRLLMKSNA